MPPNPGLSENSRLGPILVFGFYAFICFMGLALFTMAFSALGYLAGAVAGVTATAFVANWISIRVFERGRFLDVGFWWSRASRRNVGLGLALGIGSALMVTAVPLLLGLAEFVPDPANPGSLAAALHITAILIFGAVAEELMFHGYAFQVLARGFGAAFTLAITSALFGVVHMGNLSFSPLALANTILFGVILGLAMLRSGALWLPIALHFGWNWVPPLIGVNLSGFTMGVTGYSLRWNISDLWSGGAYGPEGGLLTTGIALILLFVLAKMPVEHEMAPPRTVTTSAGPSSEA